MPQIIPIEKINKTIELSQLCHDSKEPVFITNEGYSEMVIMSMDTYIKTMLLSDTYRKLDEGERSIQLGHVMDGFDSLQIVREKYGL
ncbi:MAG: type II toxin-antitoxin system Phd/YefM family antitoxin [Oscillospiraceae bacterium]|nr:type II toxin-antitoxin system Phd/YefM family antitoxin [Oscillospiraceae bacterium]